MTALLTHPKAQTGRRVTFAHHYDPIAHPGIITSVLDGAVKVRLDGQRSSIHVPIGFEGLRYLDDVVSVPSLPMGRFRPTAKDLGDFVFDGVAVVAFDEDEDAIMLTDDPAKAVAAAGTYLREVCDIDDESTIRDEVKRLVKRWVVFEWQPEGAECPWLMDWASEGDDMDVQLYYLPA